MTNSGSTSSSPSVVDSMTNLSNLLPTGSFLAFQALAPLFTNSGNCGTVEKIMSGLLIGIFECIVFLLNFTDSITMQSGKIYYGLVTTKGLYNPQFKGSNIPGVSGSFYTDSTGKYIVNRFDFINGVLNVLTFATLSFLTAPITTCYYPSIPSTIAKCVPILFGLTVGMYFAFAPPGRHGIGFAIITGGITLVADGSAGISTSKSMTLDTMRSSKKLGVKASLLEKGGNNSSGGGGDSDPGGRGTSKDFDISMLKSTTGRTFHANPTFDPTTTATTTSATPPLNTPASSPLHRNAPRATATIFLLSPNTGNTNYGSQPESSPNHRSSNVSPIHRYGGSNV